MESHVSPQSFSVILDQVAEFRIGRVYIVLAAESVPAGVQEPRRRYRQGTWKGDLHPSNTVPPSLQASARYILLPLPAYSYSIKRLALALSATQGRH